MNISNITPPQVWTASSRSLTNIGSGALAQTATVQTTLAASGTVNFFSGAGVVGVITIAVKTGAAATAAIIINASDGTHVQQMAITTAGASAVAAFSGIANTTVAPSIANLDGANAGTYMTMAYAWTI